MIMPTLRSLWFLCLLGAATSCADDGLPPEPEPEVKTQALHIDPFLPTVALNTFDSRFVQIDQLALDTGCAAPCLDPDDANLVLGNDVSGSASVNQPAGPGGAVYIDWTQLSTGGHRVLDVDLASGKDPTAFPGSDHCVGAAAVPGKEDIRYVGVSNNNLYAYFSALRNTHSGDSVLVWLLTRVAPVLGADGEGVCGDKEQPLSFDIEPTDVLLRMHFHPGATDPILAVYTAVAGTAGAGLTDAVAAMNFGDPTLWTPGDSVAAAAINTSNTEPGTWGTAGAGSLSSGNFQDWMFVEGAVPMSLFGSTCNSTYFGTVIDRASGSGDNSPDPKDVLFGRFNFGSPSATATLSADCDVLHFEVTSVTGPDGAPVDVGTVGCAWTIKDATDTTVATPTTCSGDITPGPGTYTASVVVSASAFGVCTASVGPLGPVTVVDPLAVGLAGAAGDACVDGDDALYTATPSGGQGPYTYTWHGAGTGCSSSSNTCTIDPSNDTMCTDLSIYVTVDDTTSCPAVDSPTWLYHKDTVVSTEPAP